MWDVIIIGGGASGMMAAATAGSLGKKVLILEKNQELGEKLKISGGGRCNVTNAQKDLKVLLKNYGEAEQYLYTPFSEFGNEETFKYFEKQNLVLVVQARDRVFPHTEKASDVYNALLWDMQKYKVEIKSKVKVNKMVSIVDAADKSTIEKIITNKGEFFAKSFILATGGVSHPETGSTGDGFRFLKDLGHTVKSPTPSIVPIKVYDSWVHVLSGISAKDAKITFFLNDKKQFVKKGDILFTHFGLSGPLILNSASNVGVLLQSGEVKAYIDLYPNIDHKELDDLLINIFDNNKNKLFKNILNEIAPNGMAKGIEVLLESNKNLKINLETKVHSIQKEDRRDLMQLLKALPINIISLMGYDRAVVADGGVILDEIDMKNMRSKIHSNLYIIGDLLNINKPSGGFSLQLCWTTGFLAGTNS